MIYPVPSVSPVGWGVIAFQPATAIMFPIIYPVNSLVVDLILLFSRTCLGVAGAIFLDPSTNESVKQFSEAE